jgi:hypothetical protein
MAIVFDLNFGLILRCTDLLFYRRLLDYFLQLLFLVRTRPLLFYYVRLSLDRLLGYFLDLKKEVVLILARLQSKTGKVLVIVRILPQSVLGKRT